MLTDKEKEIALECWNRFAEFDHYKNEVMPKEEMTEFVGDFLSRIREEQEAISGITLAVIGRSHFGNPIPSEWYSAAKELLSRFTIPPAAPDCSELVEALNRITELNSWEAIHTIVYQTLANHAKRTKGEE